MAYLMYIGALVIFGTNGILAAHMSLDGSQIVLVRTLIGGALLTAFVCVRGGFDRASIKKERIPILFGGIALGLNWTMLFIAYQQLNVSLSTLIYYTGPILVLLFSPLVLKESLSSRTVVSALIVGAGLLCISGSIVVTGMNPAGLLFAVLSALFYATLIVANKRIVQTSGLQTAAIELDIAFIVVLLYVLLTSGLPTIDAQELPYILIIGFINTGVAYVLYFFGMQKLSGQSVALLSYTEPVAALVLSALLLHEVMTPVQTVGSVLIIGGAIFGEMRRRKRAVVVLSGIERVE